MKMKTNGWRNYERWHSVIYLLLLSTFFFGCKGYDAAKYNPYHGPLVQLVPKQIDQYLLSDIQESSARGIEEIERESGVKVLSAVKAKYSSEQRAAFELHIVNFLSSEDTTAQLLKRAGQLKVQSEDKVINGTVVGKRMVAEGPLGAGAYWTNGSLFCLIERKELDSKGLVTQIESQLTF